MEEIVLSSLRLTEVNPGNGGLYIDLLNVQWWQAIMAILIGLGLSPAPWLTAMATGRLLFRNDLDQRLAERDRVHEKALAERDRHHAALMAAAEQRHADLAASNSRNAEVAERERERADKATESLGRTAEALEANSHIMAAFRDTVEQATNDS